jgi:hypothetical protein
MSLMELCLKGALITAGSVGAVQGCFAIIRSKSPVSAKVQALATLTSYIVYNAFLYISDNPNGSLKTGHYFAALQLGALVTLTGIILGNQELEKRKDYDFFTQFMISANAQLIMTAAFSMIIANTLFSDQ